ncbi:ubiquitin carboxyl-terminal hydrolase 47 isoform X2 [Dendroctonus ponderosae]|uniref:Ubiquitin carboxyl-terminal hydrolase 47 n=1 Tax=Dendroctonus ponderosae TaxID=77166 RepID=A0AAR5QC09_DENPD|nr:ubiquitin carboxyl-terminal hydrolase 47 isoform X2 [Dendroctonus ponderosae]
MVGPHEEHTKRITFPLAAEEATSIPINPEKSIDSIFTEIGGTFSQCTGDLQVAINSDGKESDNLEALRDKIAVASDYELLATPRGTKFVPEATEDELVLGASASPTTGDATGSDVYRLHQFTSQLANYSQVPTVPTYVGLVNQAMTCYLNSLLQALYMTPEFRNALYNWEFDGANESRSIPYQLQKLFLRLQTSKKPAVETTDLTTSFGWQGSDAWQQHDIQELCRVMFDALEHKFVDTKQANLINDLYEGKMLDYVKCLECKTEKSREDMFLDIPLPVRPFGSTVAYNSVEEALRAFVQPEILDGNNQYFCERCNKKCDAHKGLKFTKFPYLLTLHLKRFDFDYSTMHRIKLNDKVTFPEVFNLNSFVPTSKSKVEHGNNGETETVVKCDDCSTTDSGSVDDESCQDTDVSSTVNGHYDNCGDSDEGIDVSSGNRQDKEPTGPYVYELFSIMIHSGSASGGHYYAYVKDFDKNLWFCFNDQNVSPITSEDIRKTYGGGPQRAYYSGAYSSSTNAYMLMYRQIDKERNCRAMTVSEFPPHLQRLLKHMQQKDEEDLLNRKKEDDMVKLNVWCNHPTSKFLQELKISTFMDSTLGEIAQHAYNRFKLDGLVSINDCRLVAYNAQQDCICCSFDSDEIKYQETLPIATLFAFSDFMLEIRDSGTVWRKYHPGGINIKIYPILLKTEDVLNPVTLRVDACATKGTLKEELGQLLGTDPSHLEIVLVMYNKQIYFKNDSDAIQYDVNCANCRIYVAEIDDSDPEEAELKMEKLKELVDKFNHMISIIICLPDTDAATLEMLSIPALDFNENTDKQDATSDRESNSPNLRVSPQPGLGGMCGDGYDQSNSEDSSLSESDRTLIGDAPTDCLGLSSSQSASPQDHHMASLSDPCQDSYNHEVLGMPRDELMHWDDPGDALSDDQGLFFKVSSIGSSSNRADELTDHQCQLIVDRRMTFEALKKHLESILRVSSEYFKIFKCQNGEQTEWTRMKETMQLLKDGDVFLVKLGRVLRSGEQLCKVYLLKPDNMSPNNFLCEQVIYNEQTIGDLKKAILKSAKAQNGLDIPYSKCRLREKHWKRPKKVYLDDQKFGVDVFIDFNGELYLQELTEPDTLTSTNQVVVFVRKFSPSELTLGPYQEVVLDLLTMEDLRTKILQLSNIPISYLDVAHVKGNYPYDIHILEIHNDLEWNPKVENLDQWPLAIEDGCIFFYKDNREALKELTAKQKKEISEAEDYRLGRPVACNRERALKIYVLDSSPSKSEGDID